jgi:hypothetical protein
LVEYLVMAENVACSRIGLIFGVSPVFDAQLTLEEPACIAADIAAREDPAVVRLQMDVGPDAVANPQASRLGEFCSRPDANAINDGIAGQRFPRLKPNADTLLLPAKAAMRTPKRTSTPRPRCSATSADETTSGRLRPIARGAASST